MPKVTGLKPGEPVTASGEYERRGPRNGHGPEVTVPKGHKLPPGKKGCTYNLTRPAKKQIRET
jgi:hypothetical protein